MHKLDGIAELEAACMREHFNLARGNGSNAPSEKVSHLLIVQFGVGSYVAGEKCFHYLRLQVKR